MYVSIYQPFALQENGVLFYERGLLKVNRIKKRGFVHCQIKGFCIDGNRTTMMQQRVGNHLRVSGSGFKPKYIIRQR